MGLISHGGTNRGKGAHFHWKTRARTHTLIQVVNQRTHPHAITYTRTHQADNEAFIAKVTHTHYCRMEERKKERRTEVYSYNDTNVAVPNKKWQMEKMNK